MKIIQISATEFKIYGLGDDGKLYQLYYENFGEYGNRHYWKEIKMEPTKD